MTSRSVEQHSAEVQRLLAPLLTPSVEDVAVVAALGRVLGADVHSPLDLPLFRNSQMDGFAVAAASLAAVPITLVVTDTIAAGPAQPAPLTPGTAVRIMTGAVIPDGADAIVPIEDTNSAGDTVTIRVPRRAGEYVRDAGTDVRTGELLLRTGATLGARHLSLLAAVGLATVTVRRRPRVAVIATGAELVPAGNPLLPGQIYESNSVALAANLTANGAQVVSVDRSDDDLAAFSKILYRALASADLVITSGGVSMGDFEVVREVLTPLGGWFGHTTMQPGGPQGLAEIDGVPVLNFPGNPVSTMVSFEVFARPVLRRVAGLPPVPQEELKLMEPITSIPGKHQFLRGRRVDGGVTLESGQGSHLVAALARADLLIDLPEKVTAMELGDNVRVWPL